VVVVLNGDDEFLFTCEVECCDDVVGVGWLYD